MSDLGVMLKFVTGRYRQRAGVLYAAHVTREPLARLQTRYGREDPYRLYEQIRGRGALSPTGKGNWVTVSHRVCDSVLRNRHLSANPAPESSPEAREFNASFLEMDPPDHTRLRRLATPSFSPKAVAGYRPRIERTVHDLLDRASEAGRFDLVSAFAAPLPIAVITDLLGIPDADSRDFARYGMVIGSALDGVRSLRHARELQANDTELRRLFESLFELRRHEPGDDIVSRLVAAEGDAVRPEEVHPMCVLLLVAGFETTVNLIGNAVLALLDHPDQWHALCQDPVSLAPRAVEETLRYDPPVQVTGRTALEPMDIEGRHVAKGRLVLTLLGGANRDPAVYQDPATFDIHRETTADHLAFSSGIHYCLGQPLARLEATVALQVLAERMPGLSRAGRLERRNGMTIRGPLRMPVRVAPAVARPVRTAA